MAKTFRQLANEASPLVIPGAHDALTARIIEQTGFDAFMIGGFQIVGARYGAPDIGLLGLGEISAGVRDILAVTDLPCLVDVDTGYGDGLDRWGPVPQRIASVRRVVLYDRAGLGGSDLAIEPRSGRQVARELHALLEGRAGTA